MSNPTPLVSYVVLAYMQERFIEEAVRSALGQDFPSIEFIFSDDCSSDETFSRMRAAVAAHAVPGRVISVLQPERNLGLSAHLAFAVRQARGSIIVFQAGDDVSLPGRTTALVGAFRSDPEVQMVMSNVRVIGNRGEILRPQYVPPGTEYPRDALDFLRKDFPYLIGASEAIRREVFERFGPMRSPECYEDRAFAFRAALTGRVKFVDDILLLWRHHGTNMSNFVDFDSPAAQERFRAHFVRNLRRQIIYLRQHLIDADLLSVDFDQEKLRQIRTILRKRLAAKRLELAARSAMPWKSVCLRVRHGCRHGLGAAWSLRQLAIRIGHRLYFRILSGRVKASFKASAQAKDV